MEKKFKKRAMHVQSCCFANKTYCFFCRSRCCRRRRRFSYSLISQKKGCLKTVYSFSLVERMKSDSSPGLRMKTINGQLSHLEWQEKWPCAHLCCFSEGFIGSFSNDNGDGRENGKKAIGL